MNSGFSRTGPPDTARIPNPGYRVTPLYRLLFSGVAGMCGCSCCSNLRPSQNLFWVFPRVCQGNITFSYWCGPEARVFPLPYPPGWTYSQGFVTADMIQEHLPAPAEDVLLLLCGPPPMVQLACHPNLDKLGYSQKMRFTY